MASGAGLPEILSLAECRVVESAPFRTSPIGAVEWDVNTVTVRC
jgi:hypothetical protein